MAFFIYGEIRLSNLVDACLQTSQRLHTLQTEAICMENFSLDENGKIDANSIDLNDLRIFTYVAILGSFSAAAEELNIHKSSVSRSIARLEKILNTPLLLRTTRKVRLSKAGAVVKERGAEMLQRIDDTLGYVGSLSLKPQGHLTVCVSTELFLTAAMRNHIGFQFLNSCTGVQLQLNITSDDSALKAETTDVAITSRSHLGSSHLTSMGHWLCASPEYIERRGRPLFVTDLDRHDFIFKNSGEINSSPLSAIGSATSKPLHARATTNDVEIFQSFVLQGLGIGCFPASICEPLIQEHLLIRVLPDIMLPQLEIHISYPSKRVRAPAVRAFSHILKSNLSPSPHL